MNYLRSKLFKQNRNQSNEASAVSLNNELPFEYFQIEFLIDCLMRTVYTSHDHKQLVLMCAEQVQENSKDIRLLNEFATTYSSDRALWWYFQDCFLYKILNYSLESQDIRNLYLFRKILHDIHSQMTINRCTTPVHAYRSQLMPTELLDLWISSIGQCIVVNSFLSATLNEEIPLTFLNNNPTSKEHYERVLLEIDADPHVLGSKPFIHAGSLTYAPDKNEIIFLFGSIFLINNITNDETGIYRIELTLYTDSNHEFKQIFNEMKSKYGTNELSILKFIEILKDLDRFDEAKEHLNNYLEQLSSDDDERFICFDLLGSIYLAQGDYETSLIWFNQALEFQMNNSLKINDMKLGEIYENLGRIFEHQQNHSQACHFFQKAISIYRRSLPSTHDKIIQIEQYIQRLK